MKKIKIQFSDFWDDFRPDDNFILDVLKKNFEVELSEQPDFVFCSIFGNRHLKYHCAKIFFTGENMCPDFNLVDYALGFHRISFDDRYLRYPLYALYGESCELAQKKHLLPGDYDLSAKKFCNFVISNSISDPARDQMIEALNRYKKVDSGGRYRNNVGGPVPDKIAFERNYKFTMCFENTSAKGYTTEKIMEAFAGCTIPIYWGNPDIAEEFNPKAFINCHAFDSFEDVVKEVKKIDEDDELFLSMLKEPILTDSSEAAHILSESYLSDFLTQIVAQEPEDAIRRNTISLGPRFEKPAAFHEKIDRILYLPRRILYFLHNRIRILRAK